MFQVSTHLGEDAALKATHVEQQVGVVLGVDTDKAVLPLDGGGGARQPVLDVPEHSSATGIIRYSYRHGKLKWVWRNTQ